MWRPCSVKYENLNNQSIFKLLKLSFIFKPIIFAKQTDQWISRTFKSHMNTPPPCGTLWVLGHLSRGGPHGDVASIQCKIWKLKQSKHFQTSQTFFHFQSNHICKTNWSMNFSNFQITYEHPNPMWHFVGLRSPFKRWPPQWCGVHAV